MEAMSESAVITIGDDEIKRVEDKLKVLGIKIDDQLNWNKHNDEQCKIISKTIALLRKAKDFVTQDVLVTMFDSPDHILIIVLRFGMGATIHILINYRNYKKRAARVITNTDYSIRSSQIFEASGASLTP